MSIFGRFRKTKRPDDSAQRALLATMRAALADSSPGIRTEFEAALAAGTLLLAVAELPPGVGATPAPLEEDTGVAVLTTRNAAGEEFLLAFTSPEELRARTATSPFIGMPAEDALRLTIDSGYAGLILNPRSISPPTTRRKARFVFR
jgi:hypothetical protein